VVDTFLDLSRERHLAIDKTLHDRLVESGKLHIEQVATSMLCAA
jgi:hypothetical protein